MLSVVDVHAETPGGGGYGAPGSAEEDASQLYGAYTTGVPSRANGSLAQMQEAANSN